MVKLLHFSDVHIRSTGNKIQQHRIRILQEDYPDRYLLGTGDLTDDGWASQYAAALQLLHPVKDRLFSCPGNHDFGEGGNIYTVSARRHWRQFAREFGHHYQYKHTPALRVVSLDPPVLLIGLDSNLRTTSPFDFACGQVGTAQCQALKKLLTHYRKQTPRPVLIVCLHHHPFYRGWAVELKDSAAVMKILRGNVDVLCFGHKHKAEMWQEYYDIPYILAADSLRESGQVWEITIDSQNIHVTAVNLEARA